MRVSGGLRWRKLVEKKMGNLFVVVDLEVLEGDEGERNLLIISRV